MGSIVQYIEDDPLYSTSNMIQCTVHTLKVIQCTKIKVDPLYIILKVLHCKVY